MSTYRVASTPSGFQVMELPAGGREKIIARRFPSKTAAEAWLYDYLSNHDQAELEQWLKSRT